MKRNFQFSIFNFQLNSSGFTLIELVIVIAVLGILATTLIMTLNPADQFAKANDAKKKAELSQIQKALESYYQDHDGKYPTSDSQHRIVDSQTGAINWGSPWGSYMSVLPKDEETGKTYAYYSPDTSRYYLYASLDRKTDPQVCIQPTKSNTNPECLGVSAMGVSPLTACGTGNACNYGLTSPNVTP